MKDYEEMTEGILENYDNGSRSSGFELGWGRELKLSAWDGFGGRA